jgi:hypothetical protein
MVKKSGARDSFDLGRCPLDRFTMPFAARVTLTMKSGATLTHLQEVPLGGPGHPLDNIREQVLYKYEKEATKLGPEKVSALLKSADKLEAKISLRTLLDLCCQSS